MGAPSVSATRSSVSPAPMAPWPVRMTVRFEEFRIVAADWIVSAWGTTMGGLQATAV